MCSPKNELLPTIDTTYAYFYLISCMINWTMWHGSCTRGNSLNHEVHKWKHLAGALYSSIYIYTYIAPGILLGRVIKIFTWANLRMEQLTLMLWLRQCHGHASFCHILLAVCCVKEQPKQSSQGSHQCMVYSYTFIHCGSKCLSLIIYAYNPHMFPVGNWVAFQNAWLSLALQHSSLETT